MWSQAERLLPIREYFREKVERTVAFLWNDVMTPGPQDLIPERGLNWRDLALDCPDSDLVNELSGALWDESRRMAAEMNDFYQGTKHPLPSEVA